MGEGLRDIAGVTEVESTRQASAWTNEKRLSVAAQAFSQGCVLESVALTARHYPYRAERVGFEPTEELPLQRFSKPPH